MISKLSKVKLKGNESFNFREGWLRKGMRCVEKDPLLFSRDDVMEQLGVGSKMVKAIKYWLLATELCEERYINSGRNRALYLTEHFGKIILAQDPYFDDFNTLFLLHYHIVANDTLCIVWNIFFNEYTGVDFSRDNMIDVCSDYLQKKMSEGASYSSSLFADDCSSILKMYQPAEIEDPEESLQCPLNTLGLISKSVSSKSTFTKSAPAKGLLDKYIVLYVILQNMAFDKLSVSISDLLSAPNNIGKVFNLNRIQINEYLDQLRIAGYITINRTAGLDMVYLNKPCNSSDVLIEYYSRAQVR